MQIEWRLRALPTQRHSRTTPGSKLKADLLDRIEPRHTQLELEGDAFGAQAEHDTRARPMRRSLNRPTSLVRGSAVGLSHSGPGNRADTAFLGDGYPQATGGRALQQGERAIEARLAGAICTGDQRELLRRKTHVAQGPVAANDDRVDHAHTLPALGRASVALPARVGRVAHTAMVVRHVRRFCLRIRIADQS